MIYLCSIKLNQKKMNTNFFKGISTIEELKQAYRILAKKFHPDLGGSVEEMQQLNSDYEQMLASFCNGMENDCFCENMDLMNIIEKIISLDLTIEIVGSWVWISGNTYAYRNQLKEAGFFFASVKKMWYWRAQENKTKNSKGKTMDEIRNKYGSEKIQNRSANKLK